MQPISEQLSRPWFRAKSAEDAVTVIKGSSQNIEGRRVGVYAVAEPATEKVDWVVSLPATGCGSSDNRGRDR
jgi:hypothetical protein